MAVINAVKTSEKQQTKDSTGGIGMPAPYMINTSTGFQPQPQGMMSPNSYPMNGGQVPQQQYQNLLPNNISSSALMSPSSPIYQQQQQQQQFQNMQQQMQMQSLPQTLNSGPSSFTLDLNTLTDSDKTQLRFTLNQQLTLKVARFSRLASTWSAVYYVLGVVSLLSNALVIGLSSSDITNSNTVYNDNGYLVAGSNTKQVINAIVGFIAGFTVLLNSFLQCRLNAAYFMEASGKFSELGLLIWGDLTVALDRYQKLNEKYSEQGVGNFFDVQSTMRQMAPSSGSAVPSSPIDLNAIQTSRGYPKKIAIPHESSFHKSIRSANTSRSTATQ